MMESPSRRQFLKQLAVTTGGIVLLPMVTSCKSKESQPAGGGGDSDLPNVKPGDWDPMSFNKTRGTGGAIPEGYMTKINGPEGDTKHLGKHLPYLPEVDANMVPEGHLAVMFGDSSKGFAQHPCSAASDNSAGHWYDWVRVRKSAEEADEMESTYPSWPPTGDSALFAVSGGGDITANKGKNTIYIAKLPGDVAKGDMVRVTGHCSSHGEYVDFMTVA